MAEGQRGGIAARWLGRWRDQRERARQARAARDWAARAAGWPQGPGGERMLHVGCGKVDAPGFINLDAVALPHVHIVHANLHHFPMIPEAALDFVYLSHVLEHVGRREVVAALTELRRILRPGGTLRLSVPDFDHIVRIYAESGNTISAIDGPLMGGQDRPYNYHYAVFNAAHLRAKLEEAGFTDIRHWDPDDCAHHDFDDWASGAIGWGGRRFPISLNMEATKPR